MSDNQLSGTLGGLIGGLFGSRTNEDGTRTGNSSSGKMLGGALLAAGAAYLYKRYKDGRLTIPGKAANQ